METIQYGVRAVMAVLVGLWHALPQLGRVLFVLMLIDVALSAAISIRERRWEPVSRVSSEKVGIVAMVAVAAYLNPYTEPLLGINLAQAAATFYMLPQLASITGHASTLGVPSFPQLQQAIEALTKSKAPAK